ncbi:MAG: FlgD immunoglobulin-like domain containing protein [Candidatus Latescibacteria bacterium]|nr:FlgD immunoglobulin-like domain containing protein [Candidatus Latescibacterota bacterium]
MTTLLACLACAVTAAATPAETKIQATDAAFGDRFGCSLAVSDGFALIGAQANDDDGGDSGCAYVLDLGGYVEVRKLRAADAAGGDYFGCAVGLCGQRAVIGALRDDHSATDTGAAYLFGADDGIQHRKLTAADAAANDQFGCAVAVSDSFVLVGARYCDSSVTIYDSGAAYLFDPDTGVELFKLIAADYGRQDQFGYAVAVSDSFAVIGAPMWDAVGRTDCGAVYVFDPRTGVEIWRLTASDQGAYDRFGNAVALCGRTLLVGAYWGGGEDDAGAAYVFDVATGVELRKLTAADADYEDWFGSSVALSGELAVIGASQQGYSTPRAGLSYVFNVATGAELLRLAATGGNQNDDFGVAVGIDGGCVVVGADKDSDLALNAGAVYVYDPIADPTGSGSASAPPAPFEVKANPNPFNPATEIEIALTSDCLVSARVYDAGGKLRRVLLSGAPRPAGVMRLRWDGRDDAGRALPSGVYCCEVRTGTERSACKMVLTK